MAEPTPPGAKKPAPPAKPAAAKPAAPAKPAAGGKAAPAAKAGDKAAPAAPSAELASPPLKAELRARLSRGKPARFNVGAAGVVLGRDDSAAVAIPLDGVSREHARIQWDGRGWWIEDLKSTNGTFLNGNRVVRDRLQHLDVIGLGRKADLVFVLRKEEAAPVTRQGIVRAALVEADGSTHEIATGELTMGRSVACNVVADVSAVSKVHARIERSSDQLLLEDLGSSNGTFVNGSRVRTAVLRQGDTLELARVVKFGVVVELGEVHTSGTYRAVTPPKEGEPQFSGDWKTRYEWDSGEMAAFAAVAAGVRPAEEGVKTVDATVMKKSTKGLSAPPRPSAPAAPAKPATAPAAAAPPPPTSPTPPAAPAAPAAPAKPAAASAPPPAADAEAAPKPAGSKPSLQEVAAARGGSPPVPAKPAAPAPPAPAPPRPAAPPDEAEINATVTDMPALAAPAAARPIAVARFRAEKFDFAVEAPGRYEVGRATTTAFRVDHTTVSRRHAALTLSDDRRALIAEDLGAANGTRVNGRDLKGSQSLEDGDVLQLGEVSFTVALQRS